MHLQRQKNKTENYLNTESEIDMFKVYMFAYPKNYVKCWNLIYSSASSLSQVTKWKDINSVKQTVCITCSEYAKIAIFSPHLQPHFIFKQCGVYIVLSYVLDCSFAF